MKINIKLRIKREKNTELLLNWAYCVFVSFFTFLFVTFDKWNIFLCQFKKKVTKLTKHSLYSILYAALIFLYWQKKWSSFFLCLYKLIKLNLSQLLFFWKSSHKSEYSIHICVIYYLFSWIPSFIFQFIQKKLWISSLSIFVFPIFYCLVNISVLIDNRKTDKM